ncbi:SMP-30/gluconolactonase/LRE family protein [Sphingopyxis sp. NJF-3]
MDFKIIHREARDRLGEGPTWFADRGELAWVDIFAPAVHLLDLSAEKVRTIPMPEAVGWIVPRANSVVALCGLRSGFAFLDLQTGAIDPIGSPEPDRPDNRLNDAKVDQWGRTWAGSKDDTDRAASGALYRLDTDLSWKRLDDGYGVTNGPAFSPDGRTLYHSDSAARTVFAFDLADDGFISNKRIWLRFEDDWGYPDGMTTDVEGCVWIAHWGGGRISRFSPDGQWIESVMLPATNITSCAFAGNRLDRLFVTSSTIDGEDEPLSGALFEVDVAVGGLAPTPFGG